VQALRSSPPNSPLSPINPQLVPATDDGKKATNFNQGLEASLAGPPPRPPPACLANVGFEAKGLHAPQPVFGR
jgi:hypothetical protein